MRLQDRLFPSMLLKSALRRSPQPVNPSKIKLMLLKLSICSQNQSTKRLMMKRKTKISYLQTAIRRRSMKLKRPGKKLRTFMRRIRRRRNRFKISGRKLNPAKRRKLLLLMKLGIELRKQEQRSQLLKKHAKLVITRS